MKRDKMLWSLVLSVYLCLLGQVPCFSQCTGCTVTNPGTNINSSSNGQVFCITATPGGNINMNITHDNVTVKVCANNVTFNGFNINSGTDNFVIESWGTNTILSSANIGEDLFEFRVHSTGARVNGGNYNSEARFFVTDGGDLSLNFNLNPGSPVNIVVDDNSTLNTQSITSNSGGSIEIGANAVMNVGGTLMFNNPTTITNQNELNITNNLVMQGGANSFSNACGESSVNVGGEFRIDAGSMNNSGTINTVNFRVNSGGPINFFEGAQLIVSGSMQANNVTNSMRYIGSAAECALFQLNSISNWNNDLTPDSEIYYCGPAASSKPGSATIGCGCASSVTNCNPTLPVEFGLFTGLDVNGVVELNWLTVSEVNNSHFEILKSVDGIKWSYIGSVSGQGNSESPTEYYFPDELPFSGVNYYRIRQVDFDGKFSYSNIISLNRDASFSLHVFPNPTFNGEVNIKFHNNEREETLLLLIDALGRELFSKVIVHESESEFFALHEEVDLKSGVYFILASNNEKLHQHKLVVR